MALNSSDQNRRPAVAETRQGDRAPPRSFASTKAQPQVWYRSSHSENSYARRIPYPASAAPDGVSLPLTMKPLCSGINVSTNAGSNARTSPVARSAKTAHRTLTISVGWHVVDDRSDLFQQFLISRRRPPSGSGRTLPHVPICWIGRHPRSRTPPSSRSSHPKNSHARNTLLSIRPAKWGPLPLTHYQQLHRLEPDKAPPQTRSGAGHEKRVL